MKKLLLAIMLIMFEVINCFGQGTWTKYNKVVPELIMSIHFSDEIHGFITCKNNKIYRTSNGGINWIDVSPMFNASSGCWYSGIYCLDSNTVIAGTNCDDFIVRTSDAGVTWDSIKLFYQPLEVYFIPKTNKGFVTTNNGLYKTNDGGLNWAHLNNTNFSFREAILFIDDSIGFVGGVSNKIFKTIDQGLTWIEYNTNMSGGTQSLYFFNNNHGIALDGDGNWAITYDQGLTWTTYSDGSTGNQVGVYFVNNFEGFKIMSNELNIKVSTNSGLTWNILSNTYGSGKSDMSFPSKCVGYVSVLSGDLLKYTYPNCNLDGIPQSSELLSDINIFPNPATDKLNISPQKKYINYIISNNLGSIIQSGELQESLSINEIPNGIYIIKLLSSNGEYCIKRFVKQ